MRRYPRATFDREIALKNPDVEFISFGHPLLEALVEWIMKDFGNKQERGQFSVILRVYITGFCGFISVR